MYKRQGYYINDDGQRVDTDGNLIDDEGNYVQSVQYTDDSGKIIKEAKTGQDKDSV